MAHNCWDGRKKQTQSVKLREFDIAQPQVFRCNPAKVKIFAV